MGLERKWMPSPSFERGRPAPPRLIVLHTTEGARTIEELGNFFANRENEVSSHAGADDKPNTVGVYVDRHNQAWTQGEYNDVSVSLEICAFARWPTKEWLKHEEMLKNVAKWIAEEAAFFDIPIVRLPPSLAKTSGRGVCQHVDISGPGGHTDCGPGFPMNLVLQMALEGSQKKETWYFLQDLTAPRMVRGQRMYYGGWESIDARNELLRALESGFHHPFRPFRDRNFEASYFIDNSDFVKEIYGGWQTEQLRDEARKKLERRLGRTLRPFSEKRTAAQGGVPWGCKNLQIP